MAVSILFQDEALLVINKPAGLAVHPGPRTPHSLEALLPEIALGLGRRRLPTIMHRLDRDTSGCLILALSKLAVRRIAGLFEARQITKTYWALLDAVPDANSGTIDVPLLKISSAEAGWRMVPDARGKPAITHWRVLDRAGKLIEFRPETGRTHQLRVHANCLGTAIVDDPVYGRASSEEAHMRLHARSLAIPSISGGTLTITAPLPDDWPDKLRNL